MSRRLSTLAVAVLLASSVVGCGGRGDVPASRGTAVPSAAVQGPTYAVVGDGFRLAGGSRVVSGDRTTPLPRNVVQPAWLSSGNVLLDDGRRIWVLDPRTGRQVGPRVPYGSGPVVSAGRIAVSPYNSTLVRLYDDRLRLLRTITVPRSAAKTDQLGEDATFSISRPVVAGGAVWIPWYVNSEDDELDDHGVLRVDERGSTFTDVARNRPVVRLYPSSDGRALLVVARDRGHEVSCAGCARDDHVEEWDTRTGEVSDLGKPPGFEEWSVLGIDKIGDRVVVRYRIPGGEGTRSVQTWVRDDDGWTEDDTQRDRLVWWQEGTPLTQVLDVAKDEGDGAPYTLRFGTTTLLTPEQACARKRQVCGVVTAPGSSLPPARD